MPKAGPLILHNYLIDVSVEDDVRQCGWTKRFCDMELPHNVKLTSVLAKVERALGMSGYTMTQDYIEIAKGERILREDTP